MFEEEYSIPKDYVVILCEFPDGKYHEMIEETHRITGSHHSNGGAVSEKGAGESSTPASDKAQRAQDKMERETLELWRRPVTTLHYTYLELFGHLRQLPTKFWENRRTMQLMISVCLLVTMANRFAGPHQPVLLWAQKKLMWCFYWFSLGVLSSIGLGTGLHTFLLYLGPHIASVTIAAYECGALNFPEPPYPDEIRCPDVMDPAWSVSLWHIMCKVSLEAVMWGAGTAAGELPPYFMARAARLSGYDPDDEDELREYEEFQKKKELHPESLTFIDRLKLIVENLVERAGFFGILACASIPNPLFDLAGITCGHFLVPFWTFFGATLIGKAVVKMMIQQTFVIVAFNEALIAKAVASLSVFPLGSYLQAPVMDFFTKQKERFHNKGQNAVSPDGNWISTVFEVFNITMLLYFVISIVNSLAQSYHKRLVKSRAQKESKD